MATPFLPGVIVLLSRDDAGAAKRARGEDPLAVSAEADARGWSSSVPERRLALRRRRGPAPSSSPWGCGWVTSAAASAAEELGCLCEGAATPDAAAGVATEETEIADPSYVAYCSKRDPADFDPPPMALPLLPLCAFITDLLKARSSSSVSPPPPPLLSS